MVTSVSNKKHTNKTQHKYPKTPLELNDDFVCPICSKGVTPNAETLEAMAEVDEMIRTGGGQHFTGSTEEFFEMLLKED